MLATYLVSNVPPPQASLARQAAVPQEAVVEAGPVADLGEQADRLRAGVATATKYREPVRNAFRFGEIPRPVEPPAVPRALDAAPPVMAPPPPPPFALAGMASTVEGGAAQRTAILTSLRGVLLVKEGDVVEGGYRVVAIDDSTVTVESTRDGTRTTLRLQ